MDVQRDFHKIIGLMVQGYGYPNSSHGKSPPEPTKPCPQCGGTHFWWPISRKEDWKCVMCQSPASGEDVYKWSIDFRRGLRNPGAIVAITRTEAKAREEPPLVAIIADKWKGWFWCWVCGRRVELKDPLRIGSVNTRRELLGLVYPCCFRKSPDEIRKTLHLPNDIEIRITKDLIETLERDEAEAMKAIRDALAGNSKDGQS